MVQAGKSSTVKFIISEIINMYNFFSPVKFGFSVLRRFQNNDACFHNRLVNSIGRRNVYRKITEEKAWNHTRPHDQTRGKSIIMIYFFIYDLRRC
jgi:hypothetical protein